MEISTVVPEKNVQKRVRGFHIDRKWNEETEEFEDGFVNIYYTDGEYDQITISELMAVLSVPQRDTLKEIVKHAVLVFADSADVTGEF